MLKQPGRDPADSLDYRLDSGPPKKAKVVLTITIGIDKIAALVKKILRIRP